MGMGIGMNAGGNMMGMASQANQAQMQREAGNGAGQHGGAAANAAAADVWTCPQCQAQNAGGKFCSNCGAKRPEAQVGGFCPNCGHALGEPRPKFCPECGQKLD